MLIILLVLLIVFTAMTLDRLNETAKEIQSTNEKLKQRVERITDELTTLEIKLDNSDPMEITDKMIYVWDNKELFEGVGK
jgi:Sec-independent protein translocase protein TatA